MELRQKNTKNAAPTPNYAEALEELLRDCKTDYASSRLRADVRRAIDGKDRDVCSLKGFMLLTMNLDQLSQG
jgi:hypothetical protein